MSTIQLEKVDIVGDMPISGTCDERFRPLLEAFAGNLNTGQDIGASVAVFIEGEPVVDLWGGYFDGTYTRRWERDTIVQVFSSTKTMTALTALVLADHGELNLSAPVAKYWPEFAAEGKGEITMRQLLGYTAAMPGWTEFVSVSDIYDWEKSTALLARQAPWWKPGTASGYSAFNIGHMVGEVIRRITGKTLGTFFSEEIAKKVGADFHIGTGPEHDRRVSLLIPGSMDEPRGDTFYERALLNPRITPQVTWTLPWRRAEIGAANGHGNGYGIAAAQSVLANGGANGVRVMSDKGRFEVLDKQSEGVDRVMGISISWGLGYALKVPIAPMNFGPRVAWWGGNGGSMSFVDIDRRLSFGYAQNRWIRGPHENIRNTSLLAALYRALAEIDGRSPITKQGVRL